MSPVTSASCFVRQWRKRRVLLSTEDGSASCAATLRARCESGTGSHGSPLPKPASGSSVHGIGVRQPSRPLKFGQKVMP